ncbi:MAG: nucleoside monophosphate kinase [Minisyncoccia bacterium]|jgi:adenylate kinase
MTKKLVILIAPPGAGKGTQANLLAKKFGLFHLETAKIIEDKFKNAIPEDPVIKAAKEKWLDGGLVEPKVVAQWFLEKITKLADENNSVILSGSPRTLYEAKFDMPILSRLFGKENIKIFHIKLSETESIKRNSGRRICKAHRHPIPNFPEYKGLTMCPEDGSELMRRELDKPEVIRQRYLVYLEETAPILNYFHENNYPVTEINGEQPIEKVFEDIRKNFND